MQFDGAKVHPNTDQFNMTVHPFYDQKLISFLDYVGNEIQIHEREVFVRPEIKSSLKVDSPIIEHLKIYREQKQINRLFKQITLSPQTDSTALINRKPKPDSYIDVQDYAIRGTTVDLFKEIPTNLKFRSAGGGDYKARMLYEFNGITKFYSRSPLFIVNGRATRNGNYLAKLPLQEIGFFRIYSDYEFLESLSPMAHGGVVFVDMVDRNYVLPDEHTLPTLSVQGLQTPIYYPITPSFKEDSPALSSLLYWDPEVPTINDESFEIEIGMGDISTEFILDAVIYLNSGEAISIQKKIRPTL